jgi:site-specific recombinase XerD
VEPEREHARKRLDDLAHVAGQDRDRDLPVAQMWKKNEVKHPLWRACRKAVLRQIGWHVLRHTFASHLVMRGAPIKAMQELMEHATIEMTMRYSHLSPDVRKDAVSLLDRAPVGAQGGRKIENGS